ncbi:MAG: arylamine N-acetyltransferase, partial [Comamonadaceae bacterium]
MHHANLQHLDRYLRRLGFAAAPPPTLHTLCLLQLRHTAAFPFETLSTLLHQRVPIDLPSLERKLLLERRGGYCYELNGLYLALLQRLGFDAAPLSGRVVMGGPEDAQPARTHLMARVRLAGRDWLSDVGFGGLVPTAPLALDEAGPQPTPHEPFRLDRQAGRCTLRAWVGEQWRAMYVFDGEQPAPVDLEVGNWYVSTHPASPFLGRLVAARTGALCRHTLRGGSYAVHRLGQATERVELQDADAVIEVLQRVFGLRPCVDAQLRLGGAGDDRRRRHHRRRFHHHAQHRSRCADRLARPA